jgi:hypothetical protein
VGDGSQTKHHTDYVLLAVGVALIFLPLIFVISFSDRTDAASLYLRIIASLGGALVGASLPGLLEITLPGVRAAGTMAVLVLFWQFNPPQVLNKAISPSDRYDYAMGYFKRHGDRWIEQLNSANAPFASFTELRRDDEYIYLADPSRTKNDHSNNVLHLRIPINGGTAQWSWANPIQWIDLHVVRKH